MNASSARNATSLMAIPELGEYIRITACYENVCEGNNTLNVLITNEETRNKIPDEVSELSIPETHFVRDSHTHHCFPKRRFKLCHFVTNTLSTFSLPLHQVGIHQLTSTIEQIWGDFMKNMETNQLQQLIICGPEFF